MTLKGEFKGGFKPGFAFFFFFFGLGFGFWRGGSGYLVNSNGVQQTGMRSLCAYYCLFLGYYLYWQGYIYLFWDCLVTRKRRHTCRRVARLGGLSKYVCIYW